MRTISSTMLDAITGKTSVRMLAKVIIDPTRTFFKTLTDDYPYDAVPDYDAITDTPVGQCMVYSPTNNKAVTFVVDPTSGVIYAMLQGSSSKTSLGVTADPNTKPAAWDNGDGSAYVWYWNGTNLKRTTVNMSTFGVSGTITVDLPAHANWTVTGGSPHALSSTQLVFVYLTSIGGLGVDYINGAESFYWQGRFLSPNTVTAIDWSIYSAAAILGNSIFIYSTDMSTGEVRGIEYQGLKNVWTDSFIAMPADLSRFCIGNAVVANGYVHIAGQFHRTEDLASAKIYSLALRSIDGRVFSWDRFTLLSTLGYQFQIALDNTNKKVYASDRNCVGVVNMSCYFHSTPPDRVTLQPPSDIIAVNIASDTQASVQLSSYDERYMFHSVIKKGSRALLYLGYETTAGTEYILYGTYFISQRSQGFREGTRLINLGLTDSGTYLTSQIAFPFYAELLSKTSMHDDCNERDKTYPVETAAQSTFNTLVIDFWDNDYWDGDGSVTGVSFRFRQDTGLACEFRELSNYQGATDALLFKTVDLESHPHLVDRPTLAGTSITAKLFGWEHGDLSRENSTWDMYAVTAPEDNLSDKTITQGTVAGNKFFPSKYYGVSAGDYPIEYSFTGLTAGHKLLYFGIKITNTCANGQIGEANPERIEVTGVNFAYSQFSSSTGWAKKTYSATTGDKLCMPSNGIPSILFTIKPYTAFKFNIAADFYYDPGDDPISEGTTAWGCVGIAKDGYDYIGARYSAQASKVQAFKVRGGVETVLANYDLATAPDGIMLDHRDGIIQVWYRPASSRTWTGPVIAYHWNEATQGVISTSDTGIMHTGIFGAVMPPGFFCAGFSVTDASGIGMMAGFDETALDSFPDSGTIVVNGIKYTYSGKTTPTSPNKRFGPYQGRQTDDYGTYILDSITFEGEASEIALYRDGEIEELAGYLFSSENGHSWIIEKTLWDVQHSTDGVPFDLRHRSRWYCDNVNGNYINTANRVTISPGLTGISLVTGNPYIHPYGSYVALYGSDTIWAKEIVATMVEADATVRDMVSMLCKTACVTAEFPGDWTQDSLAISGTPAELASGKYLFPGGFDARFTIPALATNAWIAIYADNLTYTDGAQSTKLDIGLKNIGGILTVYAKGQSGTLPEHYFQTTASPSVPHELRVFFHEEYVSVYIDNVWHVTFGIGTDLLTWPKDVQLYIYAYASTSFTLTNLRLVELFDWREAIYIESELSAQSAIGSVIQERPVEIVPTSTGGLQLSYNIIRDTITYTADECKRIFTSHQREDGTSGDAGSDAIIYFSDVSFASYEKFAEEEGFLTRVYKLSNLDNGAEATGKILLEKAFEEQFQHPITMRPDIRIETGDKITFTYVVPGTERTVSYTVIVESKSISIAEGRYTMSIKAREDL